MPHENGTKAPAPTPAAPGTHPKPSGPQNRMADAAIASLKLESCKFCNRKFAGDRVEAHQNVCRDKNKGKQRKVYDSTKHRLSGTDAEKYLPKLKNKPLPKHPPNNWRQQSEALKGRSAAGTSGGGAGVPAPAMVHDDYVQCPYCARRFNPAAAERHIPQCKDMIHNKPVKPTSK